MAEGKTTFVSMRLDADLVRALDELAETEGLSRTAVIERLCRREFEALKITGRLAGLKELIKRIDVLPISPAEGDPVVEWLLCGPVTFKSRRPNLAAAAKAGGER